MGIWDTNAFKKKRTINSMRGARRGLEKKVQQIAHIRGPDKDHTRPSIRII